MSDSPLAEWLRAQHDPDRDGGDPGAGEGDPLAAVPGAGRVELPWESPPAAGRRLRVLAALPWIVVAGLGVLLAAALLASSPDGPGPAARRGADPAGAAGAGTDTDPAADRRVGAAAVLAVRTAGPGWDPDADERRYIDLAVPESVTWVGSGAVVTVAAVVLEGDHERWHTTRAARFAVPVRFSAGAAVAAGVPWALPVVEPPAAAQVGWESVQADPAVVTDALEAAGYTAVEVDAVQRHDGWPGVHRAQVRATAPGEREARSHEPWLTAEQPVVLLGPDGPATAGPVLREAGER